MGGINNSNNKDNRGSTRGNAPFVPPGNRMGAGKGPSFGPGSKGSGMGPDSQDPHKGPPDTHAKGGAGAGGGKHPGSRLDPSHQHQQMKKDGGRKPKGGK